MRFPTPDDMAQAPNWENYLVCQFVAGCLGELPPQVVRASIEVDRLDVVLHFRMESDDPTPLRLDDIVDEFNVLTDYMLNVTTDLFRFDRFERLPRSRTIFQRFVEYDD